MQLKDLTNKKTTLAPGYRTCSGCPITTIVRHVLRATDDPVVVVVATGCLEVTTSIYPQTSWKVPMVHSLLENAAATVSGLEAAYKHFLKKGKTKPNLKFVVFAGDGASYDAGLQFLSAAVERGHDFTYVCYNNQAYMNTGIQKSGATPFGAKTMTTPIGKSDPFGHNDGQKDLTKIMVAHDLPYIAQASLWPWTDFYNKAKKAIETKGPTFLNVISPCIPGWRTKESMAIELSRLAVMTRFWPLYEVVEAGEYKLTFPVKSPLPLTDFLSLQKRFAHLLKDENKEGLRQLQKSVADNWLELSKKFKK